MNTVSRRTFDPHSLKQEKQGWNQHLAREIRELGPHIHPPVPNPAPLGLFAFGLTTALLQVKHTRLAGDTEDDGKGTENLVWGFAIFYGGLLQVIAGIAEIRRNNIFGFTAFTSYGGFWLSVGTAHIVALLATDFRSVTFSPRAMQAMLVLMGIFTAILWVCTFKMNKTICLLFLLLASTFFLLAGGVENEGVDVAAGWVGMATAATAYWLGAVEIINDIVGGGKELIPLGSFKRNEFKATGGTNVPGRVHGVAHRQVLKNTRMDHLRRATVVMPHGSIPTKQHLEVPTEENSHEDIDIIDVEAGGEHANEH